MGLNQRVIQHVLLAVVFMAGCSHQRHAAPAWKSLLIDLPEQIYVCPTVNTYKHSRVGVFRFSEPAYAGGTGRIAAEAIFDDLLKKGVFSYIADETGLEYLDTANTVALARSRGYDLVITGDVLYYFDGSELRPSKVDERIRVIHVPTGRVLWSATARSMASHDPSRDFLFFQCEGGPAQPATTLIVKNASKFSNMLLQQPRQERMSGGGTDILLNSQIAVLNELQKEVDAQRTKNDLLAQQLFEEVEKGRGLKEKVDALSLQADQLEMQLKEEIEKGEITLKRHKQKTIINIDNSICFDSGSAVLKNSVKKSLKKISSTLHKFMDNNIRIEGHTDDVPIRSLQFRSNWELSSARALAVLQYLLNKSDIDPRRLSAAGYGEFHPTVPNDSPENRRMNRRVDIVIVPSDV